MDSGRKRIPLGVVSPSAVRNAQRRRPSHDVQTSGNVPSANRENLEPNRASASMPESSFQSLARNDNFVQQPSHSTTGSCTGAKHIGGCSEIRRPNISAQTHPHSKKPPNDGHQSRFSYSGISSGISNSRLNNLGISGRMNKNAQSYLTPSQRRLRNVDFTSPSQCFPSSRLLNRNTGGADQCMPFQMPASTIRKPVTSQPNDMEHTHLSMIDESKVNWTVKVRVTRMWVSVNVGGLIMRHNMIVLDCENTHMHVVVTPAQWIQFQNLISEGSLYVITNLRVRPAEGVYRPVRTNNYISFLPSTIVNIVPEDDFIIPRHKFEFIPIRDLYDHAPPVGAENNPIFATDIIGVMENLQPPTMLNTAAGARLVIYFRISDGSISHKVSFYGPINDDTGALYAFKRYVINLTSGTIQISNLPPQTRIFINPDHEGVYSLKQRLLDDGYQHRVFGN